MTTRNAKSFDPNRLAVLHQAGKGWRILIADVSGRTPSVVDAETVATNSDESLRAHLDARNAGRALVVVPASAVICRTCSLPDSAGDQLRQALALQAEIQLPATAQPHRLGSAVLPRAPGETAHTGLLLSWPESSAFGGVDLGRPTSYAPDLAGLAALLGGHRPSDPLLWIDPQHGTVALALTHPNGGVVFRGTQEPIATHSAWTAGVHRVIVETALGAGHADAYVDGIADHLDTHLADASDASLALPDEVATAASGRLKGVDANPSWWRVYGVAAGVLLAQASGLDGLTSMRRNPVAERPSRVRSIGRQLAKRDVALITVAACLLLAGTIPALAAGARRAILRARYPDIEAQVKAADEVDRKLSMYAALKPQMYPMTKLLSDIVCNTPEGIKLETLRVQQAAGQFSVTGTVIGTSRESTARQVAIEMQRQLVETNIFEDVSLGWGGQAASTGQYQFDLSAQIARPFRRPSYPVERDFAKWTLQERKAGKGPSEDNDQPDAALAAASSDDAPSTPEPGPRIVPDEPPEDTTTARSDLGDNDPRNAPGSAASITYEPLAAEQIAIMTKGEAIAHMEKLAPIKRRLRSSDDEVKKAQIQEEWDLLMKRVREAGREATQ